MSFPNYRSVINAQGLKRLQVVAADPSARMGIGEDEDSRSLDMKLQYVTKHTTVIIPDINTPVYVAPMSRSGKIVEEDFPQAQYLGDAIGSWDGV